MTGPERLDYSDRICPPEETFGRIAPLVSAFGVTRLARITGLDRIGVPVWNAIRPNARSIAIHQGKGIRDIDAKVSAAMEALERAVAENPPLPVRTVSVQGLMSEGLSADRLDCLIAAGQQPLAETTETDWVEGIELHGNVRVWVPRDAIILDRTRPLRYWQSSDGLSSGNNPEEAIFHGILERIERDADILWKLKKQSERAATCLDPRLFADPVLDALLEQVAAAGFRIQLFDMTSDIGIPAFSALLAPAGRAIETTLRYIDVTTGSGAHPVAYRAAIRAMTEAIQSRLTLISGARDDVSPDIYADPFPEALRRDLDLPFVAPVPANAAMPGTKLGSMLETVLESLRRQHIDSAIAVRLNPGENRMAVVKLLIPQLENPEGARRQRLGGRALAKMLVFR